MTSGRNPSPETSEGLFLERVLRGLVINPSNTAAGVATMNRLS
jgi:hypothetical protein